MTAPAVDRASSDLRLALDIVKSCRLRGCARCQDCTDAARIVAAADRRIAEATVRQRERRAMEERW